MKDSNLREFYNHAFDDTIRYRSFEWQITVWATTLLAAVSTIPERLHKSCYVLTSYPKCLLTFSIFFFGITSIGLIFYCHYRLTEKRKIIWNIEKHFKIHDLRLKHNGQKLLSDKEIDKPPTFYKGIEHLIVWIISIVLVTIYSMLQLRTYL